MCGIVYGWRKDGLPVNKAVQKRYESQKVRGQKGFGYIPIENGYVRRIERAETEKEIMDVLMQEKTNEILFHHRYPTSTPNYCGATHPIVVENPSLDFNYYVIHNGVVNNEDILKASHEELGFDYTTEFEERKSVWFMGEETRIERLHGFNDSESAAIELAMFIDGKKDTLDFNGSASVIIVQTTKKQKVVAIFYGHNAMNPLVEENIGRAKDRLFILKSTGEGVAKSTDIMYRMDYETREVTEQSIDIGNKNKYKPTYHHMGYGVMDDDDYDEWMSRNSGSSHIRTAKLPVIYIDPKQDDVVSDMMRASRTQLLNELTRIEERLISVDSDMEVYRDMLEAEDDYSSKMTIRQELTECETEFNKLKSRQDILEDTIANISETGILSPFLDDIEFNDI